MTQMEPVRPLLFCAGDFALHSGSKSKWKINCNALLPEDWQALALMAMEFLPSFGSVEGVSQGGLKLAEAMRAHVFPYGPVLICDDVLTTGRSMEEQRAGRKALGLVAFSRAKAIAPWIYAILAVCQEGVE